MLNHRSKYKLIRGPLKKITNKVGFLESIGYIIYVFIN